jgi:hypothetical protein
MNPRLALHDPWGGAVQRQTKQQMNKLKYNEIMYCKYNLMNTHLNKRKRKGIL